MRPSAYGYVVVDAGPHPNPRKAAEGFRLRALAIEDGTAEVVRRIFAEYMDGRGDRAIANGLNRDAIRCPSAHRSDRNRHRLADGWQGKHCPVDLGERDTPGTRSLGGGRGRTPCSTLMTSPLGML